MSGLKIKKLTHAVHAYKTVQLDFSLILKMKHFSFVRNVSSLVLHVIQQQILA